MVTSFGEMAILSPDYLEVFSRIQTGFIIAIPSIQLQFQQHRAMIGMFGFRKNGGTF